MPSDDSPLRIRVMTAVIILATFVAGGAAGLGLSRWLRPDARPPPPPMGLPLHELGLSPEQDARAREISERHRDELETILREMYPRVRAVNDQIEKELRVILTPEQIRRLDEIKARRPQMPRGPGGPGGPGGPHGGGPHPRGPGPEPPPGGPPPPPPD